MEPTNERVSRGYLSSTNVERLYPACVVRIARGELTYAEQARINGQASRMDSQWRGGDFNGLQYFHFRFPEQSATMAGFLLRERLHRLVPGSGRAATPGEIEAEWQRMAAERGVILAWARSTKTLIEIVQTYRFDIFSGGFVHILAAEQGLTKRDWYQGTADAVRQNHCQYSRSAHSMHTPA